MFLTSYPKQLVCLTFEILVFHALGPDEAQGFQIYLESGSIVFKLRTDARIWFVSAPYAKPANVWVNLAVVWGGSTQTLTVCTLQSE